MLGQGSPTTRLPACAMLFAAAGMLCALFGGANGAHGAEMNVRLRLAWGSGAQSPQKWVGKITLSGATFESLQPLGIEADEAAALRLMGNEIVVSPLVNRAFDGCDVTVRGGDDALIRFELRNSAAEQPASVVEVPLAKAAKEPFDAPLDGGGAGLLVHRSPGDVLRVSFQRDHLVFEPKEQFSLALDADLDVAGAAGPISIEARVHCLGSAETIWQTTLLFDAAATAPIPIDLSVPEAEGVYRLSLTAGHRQAGLAGRLVPWDKTKALASRDVEFVVIDPAVRLPALSHEWRVVETIDPASSSWWRRIPQWTQVDKLPAFASPRPLGNVKPHPAPGSTLGMVELPTPVGDEPAWQAYVLPVREPGEPYAVEVDLPRGQRQHLAVSLIEPDAAGRVTSFGRDWGAYSDDRLDSAGGAPGAEVHRIDFWPRSRSPILLVANRSTSSPVQYGKIRLLRRTVGEQPAAETPIAPVEENAGNAAKPSERLAAAYVGSPRFADAFGAAEELDPVSGLSVDGWATFLDGSTRLAQQLRAAGYNAAIVSVAADGSSLAPIAALGAAPRYDTGLLAGSGVDPVRKDVLEALLRIFDREGLRLIPAVQLSTPLPGLEALRAGGDARVSGVEWIGADGRRWAERYGAAAEAPHYNLLNSDVRAGVGEVVEQLVARYGKHQSLAGVALQLSGNGYGVLPGLAWGMDDATAARFAIDSKIQLPTGGDDRFRKRAELVLGQHQAPWRKWRTSQTTAFYADLAGTVRKDRPELQLVLCTEDLFSGVEAAEELRQALAGRATLDRALEELGIDARQLSAAPGVSLLRPRRLGADNELDDGALDLRINAAAEIDQAVEGQAASGELHYHTAAPLRLASFDAQSPFGADKTYLSLSARSVPSGDAARRALVTALASRDFSTLAEGGELAPIVENDGYVDLLRVFQELPLGAEVRTERRQPVTMRVYREAAGTTVCVINESPWAVTVELPVVCDAPAAWHRLGSEGANESVEADITPTTANSPIAGTLPAGSQQWSVALPPYGVEARRFATRGLKVGAFTPAVSDEARAALARRVAEIEQRMRSLDVQREYHALENPGFEAAAAGDGGWGWQPRVGEAGSVDVDATIARSGSRSLHLQSGDALGVAAQSHLIAIPTTGQLAVRAHVRTRGLAPDAQLYARVEYDVDGTSRQRHAPFSNGKPLGEDWTECEFALDDLPLGGAGKIRIMFHLAGQGEAWVDDVQLYDLRFPESQRVEFFKRLYAANAALDEGQLVDCQRLVDGYWARYLMEHVPMASMASAQPDSPTTPTVEGESQGFGRRIRGIVPRVWR